MTKLPLLKEAILPRLDGISQNLKKLRELTTRGLKEFEKKGDVFDLAQHHLRLALEGIFHLGAHLLSRLEGGRSREYSEIALRLGELGIVSAKFAKNNLVPMAKMRNLLTHFYAEIEPKRFHQILKKDLVDIEKFLQAVKRMVEKPARFGLTIE